jgi:predicted esterase
MQSRPLSLRCWGILGLSLVACGAVACGSDDGSGPGNEMGTAGASGSDSTGASGSENAGGDVTGAGGSGTGGSAAGAAGSGMAGSSAGNGGSSSTADAGAGDGAVPKEAGPGLAMGINTARPLGSTDAKNGFWEYLPKGYGNGTLSPLMVFWHGIGENGSGSLADLNKVPANGPPKLIKANQWPADRPFVVLSPQHAGGDCPSADEIHNFIAFAMGKYEVDPKRVYLTGLSCGALGSASYFAKYGSEVVAASALMSGDATPIWNAKMCGFVSQTAFWAFHGDADPTVSINGDNTVMPKFLACPKPPKLDAQYTVYPGVGHDSWSRTYDLSAGHDIYTWMLMFAH